ncbi:hypothetical protein CJ193_004890 [Pseudoglutamicibacter albus]|uniref:hypothetical protein n=1 Tax=Pseudoglutamicibacter albus TaxID=98671 RepID=UPI002542CC4F|nr:hypothetical protein [Pseudoglutamicibacter albus]WIK83446.1 hypothetical protein CJ193_004890 [Pseudoglutamicibacter albus]
MSIEPGVTCLGLLRLVLLRLALLRGLVLLRLLRLLRDSWLPVDPVRKALIAVRVLTDRGTQIRTHLRQLHQHSLLQLGIISNVRLSHGSKVRVIHLGPIFKNDCLFRTNYRFKLILSNLRCQL